MLSPGTENGLSPKERVSKVMEYWKEYDNGNWQVLNKRLTKAMRACQAQAVKNAEDKFLSIYKERIVVGEPSK